MMNEQELDVENEQIRIAEKVAAFLGDADIAKAFDTLDARYLRDWKAAEKPSERETLWAQSRALDDMRRELQIVVDTGHRAATVQSRRKLKATRSGT